MGDAQNHGFQYYMCHRSHGHLVICDGMISGVPKKKPPKNGVVRKHLKVTRYLSPGNPTCQGGFHALIREIEGKSTGNPWLISPDTTRFFLGLFFLRQAFVWGLSWKISDLTNFSRGLSLECEAAKQVVRTYGGFLSHGSTSIAGWFISWKSVYK